MSPDTADSMEFDETQLDIDDQFESTSGPNDLDPLISGGSLSSKFPTSSSLPSHSTSKHDNHTRSFQFHNTNSSSAESSAFISHPEAQSSDLDLSNMTDMDSSLTSMRESLAQLRVNSPDKDVSPWRRLRSAPPVPPSAQVAPLLAHFGPNSGSNFGLLAPRLEPPGRLGLGSSPTKPGRFEADLFKPDRDKPDRFEKAGQFEKPHRLDPLGSGSAARIDDLTKQITDYRIQIRLLRQFIHRLVQRLRVDGNGLDVAEQSFVQEFASPTSDLAGQDERFDEILKLNEDLYASLEAFQAQIRDKDKEIADLRSTNSQYETALDSIIREHGENPPSSIAERVLILRLAIHNHMLESIAKIEQLLNSQNDEIAALNARLGKEAASAESAQTQLRQIVDKVSTLEPNSTALNADEDVSEAVSKRLDHHHSLVEKLTHELKSVTQELETATQELEALRKSVPEASETHLEEALKSAVLQFEAQEEESQRKIAALNSQIASLRLLLTKLRDEESKDLHTKQELEKSVEKQRVLRAEKVRLSHQVQSLLEDKESATSTIERLNKKLAAYKSQSTLPEASSEYQLFQFDVEQFLKMLASFEKIADDSSLRDPKRHFQNLQQANLHADLLPSHRFVFKYLSRAVDVLVNDHVKLLLKEAEVSQHHNDYMTKLQKRIDELSRANDSLSKQLDDLEDGQSASESTMTSPRAKLRIDELVSRWKAEREARVYENREASRRVKELETENAKLRAELYRS